MSIVTALKRTLASFLYPMMLWVAFTLAFKPRFKVYNGPQVRRTTEFDSSNDPSIFFHATDLHIGRRKYDGGSFKAALDALAVLNSSLVVVTGDFVEARNQNDPEEWSQQPDEWDHYLTARSSVPELFEVCGNHDLYSQTNSSICEKMTTSTIRPNSLTRNGLRIVSYTPMTLPTGHGCQLVNTHHIKAHLDELDLILANDKSLQTVVVSHYPTTAYFPGDQRFSDILSKYNVVGLVAGHHHPPSTMAIHHDGWIEVIGEAFTGTLGIVAIDNGLLSYRKREPAVLTYPVSSRYAARVIGATFPVRVVSLDSQKTNFEVSGACQGHLERQRSLSDGTLYAMNCSLPPGKHTIRISGDLSDECDFFVGTFSPVDHVFHSLDPHVVFTFMVLSVLYTACIVAGMLASAAFEWWAGPFFLGMQFRPLPRWCRRAIIVLAIAPLLLPLGVYTTNGEPSVMWPFGFSVGARFVFDMAGFFFVHYAYHTIVVPGFALIGLVTERFDVSLFSTAILTACFWWTGVQYWTRFGGQVSPLRFCWSWYHFLWCPAAILVLFFVLLRNKMRFEPEFSGHVRPASYSSARSDGDTLL